MKNKQLIVIGGPTASGKTKLAIELARRHGTEIISGDSRQFYREMRIGNARPTPAELAAAPHHFVADRSVTDGISAGDFGREALPLLHKLFSRNDKVILVGGGGLYLRALYEGLDEFPAVSEEIRSRINALPLETLRAELSQRDPDYYASVDRQNPRRLARALMVCYQSNRPYSSFLGQRRPRDFGVQLLRIDLPRPALYDRINERVDRMLAAGLEAEAHGLYDFRHLKVLQTVGYQEWWPYFAGEYGRARAVELIKRNSRRYAKRQETWFRGAGFTPFVGR